MASGPLLPNGDGRREKHRWAESKVYTRKIHKIPKAATALEPTQPPSPPQPSSPSQTLATEDANNSSQQQQIPVSTNVPADDPSNHQPVDEAQNNNHNINSDNNGNNNHAVPAEENVNENGSVSRLDTNHLTIDVSSRSKQELRELKKRLLHELDQVRGLLNKFESQELGLNAPSQSPLSAHDAVANGGLTGIDTQIVENGGLMVIDSEAVDNGAGLQEMDVDVAENGDTDVADDAGGLGRINSDADDDAGGLRRINSDAGDDGGHLGKINSDADDDAGDLGRINSDVVGNGGLNRIDSDVVANGGLRRPSFDVADNGAFRRMEADVVSNGGMNTMDHDLVENDGLTKMNVEVVDNGGFRRMETDVVSNGGFRRTNSEAADDGFEVMSSDAVNNDSFRRSSSAIVDNNRSDAVNNGSFRRSSSAIVDNNGFRANSATLDNGSFRRMSSAIVDNNGFGTSSVTIDNGSFRRTSSTLVDNGAFRRTNSDVVSLGKQEQRLLHLAVENGHGHGHGQGGVNDIVEKRTPKANQYYKNSGFIVGKERFPPPESSKKSKSSKKHGTGGRRNNGSTSSFRYSKIFQSCSSLLAKLQKHKFGWIFNKPVDVKGLGLHDYFIIIKHPMDLGTVKTRLNTNKYQSPREFAEDIRLTFNNAMLYNPKGQDAHYMGEVLSKVFEDDWAEMDNEYDLDSWYEDECEEILPTPMTRKAPPPPLMRQEIRSFERVQPVDSRPKPANSAPPSRTPALKKPKAKDLDKRDMTFDEKQKLSTNLTSLPSEKLESVVEIIKKRNSSYFQTDDEIEVDIDSVDVETLWELDRFVTNYKKSLSKYRRRAELARAREEAARNLQERGQASTMMGMPGETKTDEHNVLHSSSIQEDKRGDNANRSSSSSSSSSDSGSSSSDSDSESSSGSDAGNSPRT